MAKSGQDPPKGKRKVVTRWIVHRKTGKRVYPKNGSVFVFYVDE